MGGQLSSTYLGLIGSMCYYLSNCEATKGTDSTCLRHFENVHHTTIVSGKHFIKVT